MRGETTHRTAPDGSRRSTRCTWPVSQAVSTTGLVIMAWEARGLDRPSDHVKLWMMSAACRRQTSCTHPPTPPPPPPVAVRRSCPSAPQVMTSASGAPWDPQAAAEDGTRSASKMLWKCDVMTECTSGRSPIEEEEEEEEEGEEKEPTSHIFTQWSSEPVTSHRPSSQAEKRQQFTQPSCVAVAV